MKRRVVITGMGTVNSLALEVAEFWQALLEGKHGISRIEAFDTEAFKVNFAGEVKNFDAEELVGPTHSRRLDRFAQFAMHASNRALADSGLDMAKEDPFRVGVCIGSGIGGLGELEKQYRACMERGPRGISVFVVPKMIANSASGSVSIEHGMRGPNVAISTACASAAHSLAEALHTIRRGEADVMLTGGAESTITHMGLGGFIQAKALSLRTDDPAKASRPFDKDRDGFVLSEGSGVLVVEELERAKKRGAPIYAELMGVGSTADAHHITAPHPEGAGAVSAMNFALADAGLNPEDVQYVNAHGTSTPLGDVAETNAIKKVFGEHASKLAISSTKSMIGHLLGASGGVEAIASVMAIKNSVVHPTINYETPDPTCDLDYVPNTAREMKVRYAISNSFGFGGHNCCVVFGEFK